MMRPVLLLMLVVGAGACDRTHLSRSYGQDVRRAFKAQVIAPAAGERRVTEQGLDPEEAAIVSKGYRDSMSPKQTEQSRTPLVILPQTQPGMPGPGVPPGTPR